MKKIAFKKSFTLRLVVKKLVNGEKISVDLAKCTGVALALVGADGTEYPQVVSIVDGVIAADVNTSTFPIPDKGGTLYALSINGYEDGQAWSILQQEYLCLMPADWRDPSAPGGCDEGCEEAIAEIKEKNEAQDTDIAACVAKNEVQDKRLDEIEEIDKRQDKRLAFLKVYPFDGQTPVVDGVSGLFFDAVQDKFVSVNDADAFAAKGCEEIDYNDASTGMALEDRLFLCGTKLYKVENGELAEYCADELRRIEELKKAASLVRLYSEKGGKALVDGYPVSLPAGELKCVYAFSSFETNGVECQMIDVSRLYTAGWTSMNGMFRNFQEGSLDLTNLNTESVTDWTDMFAGCDYLNELTLGEGFFKACLNAKVTKCYFDAVADWTEDSMRQSLVTNSYDLASEGRACRIYLAPDAYGRLTEEDLETMAGKGYTVTEVALETGIESGIWQS